MTNISGPCLSLRVRPESGIKTGLAYRITNGVSFAVSECERQKNISIVDTNVFV